jgi:hypothetical protein
LATERVERKLAAILVADVAGYSRLMGADEEGTHERLKTFLRQLIEPKIKEHRGRIVKNTGDGLLAEFPSVVDAVRCAVEIQRGMNEMQMPAGSANSSSLAAILTPSPKRGPTKLGVIPLSDGAGEVAAIGDGVTRVKIGDPIAGCFHPRWFGGPIKPDYLTDRLGANLDGMLAEYAVLNEEALVPVPSHLSSRRLRRYPARR